MAAISIDTGPIEATSPIRKVARDMWPELLRARRSFVVTNIPYDCRMLIRFVEEAEQMLEPLGYSDVPDLLRRGLEIDPELVTWAVSGLKSLDPEEAVSLEQAVRLGKHGRTDAPRDETGRFSRVDNCQDRAMSSKGGNSTTYTLARLDRDNPPLAAKVRAGELTANAAAIEAGFRRKLNRADKARSLVKNMSREEWGEFREWFEDYQSEVPF